MKALLICPATSPAFSALSVTSPLMTIPFLGQTLPEYWMSHLAAAKVRHVLILANQHKAEIEAVIGSGTRWGVEAKVVLEPSELTPEEALVNYRPEFSLDPTPPTIALLDHFPGQPDHRLFKSFADLMQGMLRWLPRALTPERVGMRELRPGVWVGTNSRISEEAELHSPCWVGQFVVIGPRAVLGPGSFVEDGSFIEADAEISASWVGPHTFVGRLARIANSVVWGNRLSNWQNGSVAVIPDPFVLSDLCSARRSSRAKWYQRFAALYSRAKGESEVPWQGLVAPEQNLTHESCPEH